MKLATKLILAFLLVSLFSTFVIFAATRIATNREFDKFVTDRYKIELVEELAKYYRERRSWDGIEGVYTVFDPRHPNLEDSRPLFFSIADSDGRIIVPGAGYVLGEVVNADELQAGTKIQVDDETAGILLLDAAPGKNPMEDEFIHRINNLVFLSGFVTVILALLLGVILSRTISRPIRELTSATHKMADGSFGQQVPVRSRDELGELAASFNKMSADLARSFNLRRQMTADIAHELRTPLSLIIGHAEAVHDGVLPPSAENFEIVREEAGRLEQLVNDLRTLSLADAGELSADFQPVDVNKLLGDIQSHYLTLFNQKRIALNLVPAPAILTANLDPVRFSQVAGNILDNALRYTPEDGRVEITVKQRGGQVEINIHDTGKGVSPEEAEHLFDRFYRTDESRARNDGGSGLGLAIVRSIIEMHKGKIWAESEKEKGLKVVIVLPLMKY